MGYQPLPTNKPSKPPQAVSLSQAQKETYERVKMEYMSFGCTAQEAADALTSIFANWHVTIDPEPIGDSSDGIALVGYEEL